MKPEVQEYKPLGIVLALSVACLIPFCFLGYGSDNDTYSVLDAGRSTWHLHTLQTSRPPGYWTFEAVTYWLQSVGGYRLTNFVTLGVALLAAAAFFHLARRTRVVRPRIFTICLIALPVFAIAAVSTDDYVWSLLGLLLMMNALFSRRWPMVILAGVFAYLIRPTNGAVILGLFVGEGIYLLRSGRPGRILEIAKLAATGLLICALGSLPILLTYRVFSNEALHVQGASDPAMWSLKMRIGRIGFKTIMLFGVPAFLWLVGAVVRQIRFRKPGGVRSSIEDEANYVLLGGMLANFVLFVCFPIEISYLIPGAACLFLLVGRMVLPASRTFAVGLMLTLISADLVTVQIAKPNKPNKASSATFGLALVPGQLLSDASERRLLEGCANFTCYHDRTGN